MTDLEKQLDDLPDSVIEATAEAIGGAMDCLRVWSAWGVGTMSADDFAPVADDGERVAEIARAAITAYLKFSADAAPPPAPAVPDEMQYSVVSKGERIPDSYVEGWNDCRNSMLAAQVDQSGIKTMLKPGTQEYGSAINAAANMADQCFVFHKDKFKWLCKFEQSFRSLNAPTAKPQVKASDAS